MENPLLKKLQIKAGFNVLVINAPENFNDIFGKAPGSVNFSFDFSETYHVLIIFAITKAYMLQVLDQEHQKLDKKCIIWIIYPKAKTKFASDLNLMQSWGELKKYNLVPCASAAIDSLWTALRIKPFDSQKKSGVGNAEIQKNDYGGYIDVINKTVILPADLKAELDKHQEALNFFQELSYSNRKEYVLWILTAKQEKTRLDRIQKTIEKLLSCKKNPSEK